MYYCSVKISISISNALNKNLIQDMHFVSIEEVYLVA